MTLSKVAGAGLILWAGVEATYFIWQKLASYQGLTKSNDPVNTVLFFDSRSPECLLNDHKIDKCPFNNCPRRNMSMIENYLENAKSSIDIAMYKLTSTSLSSYLVKAIKNGVRVRVFIDREPGEEPTESKAVVSLRQAGAFVKVKQFDRTKRREQLLMHHKFVVIDGKLLITGSLNWTTTAVSGNWEDAAIIYDPSILQKFCSEFQYLWDNFETPESNLPPPVNPPIFPSDMSVWKRGPFSKVFMFSDFTAGCRGHMSLIKFDKQPESHAQGCAYTVLRDLCELMDTAEESIDICLLLLNLENVADIFLQAFYKGIKVRMITDSLMGTMTGSQVSNLIEEGVSVRGMRCRSNMHHKFIVLDKKLVFFGSFNWSMQALCGNAENLVCTNDKAIADKFNEQFEAMWKTFKPVQVDDLGRRCLR